MRLAVTLLLGLAVTASCGQDDSSDVAAPTDTTIRCGMLIDGLTAAPTFDQRIVIRKQRIVSVGAFETHSTTPAVTFDLSDYTCLPGLIDTHVHLDVLPEDADDYSVYLRRTPADTRVLAAKNAATILRAGFTTIRHTGSYLAWIDRDIREQVRSGEISGPRIRVGGPYLTIPHGGGDMHMPGIDDNQIPDYYRRGVARGPDQFTARAKMVVAGGADFIKIIASGAVFGYGGIPGAAEMTRDEIAAVVTVAHAAGIKVTAHAHGAASIKDAILAGVDSIEHASLGDDESIALARERGVFFSMDVYNGTYTAEVGVEQGYAEEFMRKNEETTEAQRRVFEKALTAGVTITFGTDLGVLPHGMGARQFAVMVAHGMTPMHAIKSATSIAATQLGISENVGAVEVGRYGDLIAVRGNPLENIRLLQTIDVVIKGGVTF